MAEATLALPYIKFFPGVVIRFDSVTKRDTYAGITTNWCTLDIIHCHRVVYIYTGLQ